MGWLYMARMDGHSGPKAYLDAQFNFTINQGSSVVLRSALTGMKTWYGACHQVDHAKGTDKVLAIICLVHYNPRASDGMIFGFKDMSESAGPYEDSCPAAILDLLSPTDDPDALDWRQRCRARLAKRARPMPVAGDTILFATPQHFADGHSGTRFIVERYGRRTCLRGPKTGKLYQGGNLAEADWTLIPHIALSALAG
jgi:hypothetical protein